MKNRGAGTQKPKAQSADDRALIRKIIQLEKEVWKVAQARNAKRFAELVPADAVMIFQSGILTQPEYLATMSTRTISRYELRDVRGFVANAAAVILMYEAVRLGDMRAVDPLTRLCGEIDCVTGRIALAHAQALAARDSTTLRTVSGDLAALGLRAAAADAAAQAEQFS